MYGRLEVELWFHRWHMWPVSAPFSSFLFIDTHTFFKDGRKINVGDCALFKPPYNSLPFVGRIRKLNIGKENNISLCVNWLYRPADIKLKEGALPKAAPNEIFYSFHKDEIPAASLLHPCKVTFLRKGVELPSGISSFVCRQVYDVESECLWWLTDRNYINELQEEVNQLLDKTLLEMHGAVQTGGRSPKPLNSPNGSAHRKRSLENVQNSSSSISSHAKSKKGEHRVRNSESVKCDRLSKVDDADSGQLRPEHRLKTEIAKITDKGGLVDIDGVEKLIQLMQPEGTDKKLDLVCRTMLVNVILGTDGYDCLARFVHLKGLLVLNEWLQEIHKGKISNGSCKENDKSVEFLFSLLCSLEKLPVNLHALQTCNVGKSVNHLRSHKNSEIQKKARSLVSTWRRRVEAEMNIIETKSSTTEKACDVSLTANGNRPKLIVRLPNTGGSPTQTASGELPEDSATVSGNGSLSVPHAKQGQHVSRKIDSLQVKNVPKTNTNTGNDLFPENEGPIVHDEEQGKNDASSSGVTPKPGKLCERSYSSINALVESCAKFSEAIASPSTGDDGGIILLASVAAGEMSRSDVSPACSPRSNIPIPEGLCSANMKLNSRSPLEEAMCPDVKPIRNTVGLLDAAATSVKPETMQIKEELVFRSCLDIHEDEKKLVHKRLTDRPVATPKSEETDEKAHENMKKDDKSTVVAVQEVRTCGTATDVTEASCVEDRRVKLDFDLNEVLPSDDGIQCEVEEAAVHAPDPLPSNDRTQSGLINVAAAAKGLFYPSESLSRGMPEIGWKDSAATSAFLPTEARKVDVPVPDTCTSKPTHTLFDFDLNVGVDDADQHNAPSGLDLDLNTCDESPEAVQLSGEPDSLKGFDLNGPGMEEVGGETLTLSKNSMQFISGAPNVRMNSMNSGNFSTWFSPNKAYPAITIPSQRMLTPMTSSTSLNPEIFRGPVLSSSPAVPFQYSAFPFETGFSVPSISNTVSSVSNGYADSPSSGGGSLCFSAIPSVGPNSMVSMPYRPYFMNLPGGSSNVGGANEQLRLFHQMAAGGGGSKRKEPDGSWNGDNTISYKHPHQQ
ncbi:putative transcription regulator IWS1 family [Helianthus annuus]|nr:putative transcription regulator IWS1 family [Helianthus annuus]KAJ0632109.1 putative transcription regulator IWS1 family [Helianthus annuus]